jgi:hypothetical protein
LDWDISSHARSVVCFLTYFKGEKEIQNKRERALEGNRRVKIERGRDQEI